jgi:hypothetical protein
MQYAVHVLFCSFSNQIALCVLDQLRIARRATRALMHDDNLVHGIVGESSPLSVTANTLGLRESTTFVVSHGISIVDYIVDGM